MVTNMTGNGSAHFSAKARVKSPDVIDQHISNRIKTRRIMVGISQEKLADKLGITFQQVQKYEKGINRISASRLNRVAAILGVPIGHFFEDSIEPKIDQADEKGLPVADRITEFLATKQGVQLVRSFLEVKDSGVRQQLVLLVSAIAAGSAQSKP